MDHHRQVERRAAACFGAASMSSAPRCATARLDPGRSRGRAIACRGPRAARGREPTLGRSGPDSDVTHYTARAGRRTASRTGDAVGRGRLGGGDAIASGGRARCGAAAGRVLVIGRQGICRRRTMDLTRRFDRARGRRRSPVAERRSQRRIDDPPPRRPGRRTPCAAHRNGGDRARRRRRRTAAVISRSVSPVVSTIEWRPPPACPRRRLRERLHNDARSDPHVATLLPSVPGSV